MYIYIYAYTDIYIYIYIERERESEIHNSRLYHIRLEASHASCYINYYSIVKYRLVEFSLAYDTTVWYVLRAGAELRYDMMLNMTLYHMLINYVLL